MSPGPGARGATLVVMPVPASVRSAITATTQTQVWIQPSTAPESAQDQPTPRLASGKPDLTGNWIPAPNPNGRYGRRRCGPTQVDCTRQINQTADYELFSPSRFGPSRPLYKPEFWDKVQKLDMWTNKEDPIMTCQPLGIPRHGSPRRIYQTDKDVTFMYTRYADAGGGNGEFRIVPTDGRKHDPKKAVESTYMGYAVGRWEGDTLVLDSISFVDTTWLGRGGFFHSSEMRVVEKFKRKGNEILHEVTSRTPTLPWSRG